MMEIRIRMDEKKDGKIEIDELNELVKQGYERFIRETSFRHGNRRIAVFHKVLDEKTNVLYNIEEILRFTKTIKDEEGNEKREFKRIIRLSSPIENVYVDEETFLTNFKAINIRKISFDSMMTYIIDGKVMLFDEPRIKFDFVENYALNGLILHFSNVEKFVKENMNNPEIPKEIREKMKVLLPHDLVKMVYVRK